MKTETIKNITVAIFLGAIGSGLWSLAGEPAFQWSIELFISTAQVINDEYYDLMHKDIGKGLHEENGVFFKLLFSSIMATAVLALPFLTHKTYKRALMIKERNKKSRKELDKSISDIQKRTKTLFIASLIYSIIASPVMISRIITQEYNNQAIVFIERSIEIMSPQLDSQEILQLRADYRSISDAKSFYELYDKLNKRGASLSIELPPFDVATIKPGAGL